MARTNWDFDEIVTEHDMNEMGQQMNESTEAIEVMKAPTGFPNRDDSIFFFDKTTRGFTIQPTGSSYEVYYRGKRFTKTATESVTIANVSGMHYIYFDANGALQSSQAFPGLKNMVYIAYVYWNADQENAELQFAPGDERHGTVMDKATHERLHAVDWTQWVSGLQLYGYTLDDGATDESAQVSLNNGLVADEDLFHNIVHSDNPTAFFEQVLQGPAMLPVMYRDGASGTWMQDEATEYPLRNVVGGRVTYNEWDGNDWVQSEVPDEGFVAYYVVFTGDVIQPIKVIQGQRTDGSLADAQANNDDRYIQWGSQPFQEFKVLYRLIYQTSSSYTNERKVALRDVLDLRAAKRSPGGGGIVPSAHSNLTGLGYAESGHTGFASQAMLAEDQTATVPLAHGTQTITASRTSPAKVKIPGRTIVNLMGRDGNCEDVSKWRTYNCDLALDSVNKVFGNYGIKITINGTDGSMNNLISKYITDMTKHYFFTGYVKNGNSTFVRIGKDSTGGGNVVLSDGVSDTSKSTRVGVKFSPNDLAANDFLVVNVVGNATEYAYVDGIQINEITVDEYNNLTVEQLLAKYPYVDSVQQLTGAYVKNETNGSHLYIMDSLGAGEVFEDGQKNKIWERKVLDGSLPFVYRANYTNYKAVQINLNDGIANSSPLVTKYDGKILTGSATPGLDVAYIDANKDLVLYISNTDSGWGPDYNPTPEEIAAYLMGWRMYVTGDRKQLYNGTGVKSWAKLWVGIGEKHSDDGNLAPTTLGGSVGTCPTLMNDQGYTPYELYYKLVTPVMVPVETEGSLMISSGDNQITLGEGVVVREVAKPRTDGLGNYCVNRNDYMGALKYKPTLNMTIYKNDTVDNENWIVDKRDDGYWFNNVRIYSPPGRFDTESVYYITYFAEPYQISASALSAELTYAENLGTAVHDTVKKVSDVEADLSGYKLYQHHKLAIVKRAISNPNLLHNPDFTVNQRGKASYSTTSMSKSITTDRWDLTTNNSDSASTLAVGADRITISNPTARATLRQSFEFPLKYDTEFTFSVDVASISGGITIYLRNTEFSADYAINNNITTTGIHKITGTVPAGKTVLIQISSNANGNSFALNRVKLELGPVSTLASDPPADYGEQLALCQRYQLPFIGQAASQVDLAPANVIITDTIKFFLPTPVQMRILPSIGLGEFKVKNGANVFQTGFTISVTKVTSSGIIITAIKTSHGLSSATLTTDTFTLLDSNL